LKNTISIAAALTLLAFFTSCGRGPKYALTDKYTDKPAYGDMLVDSSIGEPTTLNPVLASDSASSAITGLVFNGLVRYDRNLRLEGDLAKSWDISSDSKVITFHLRKGVLWQDGVEFTSSDVKFTYDKFMDPSVKTAYRSQFELVKNIETPDKYTVKVFYSEPFAPALESWGMPVIPEHILKGQDINISPFNRRPVGTGPYIFKSWTANQDIELAANKNYYEGEPYISRYMYRIIPDESVQFMNLEAGNIDMMTLTPDMYVNKSLDESFNGSYNRYNYTGPQYVYIGYNLENPLFKSEKVRQALSYAINRDDIIKNVMLNLAKPVTGPFIPGSWAYNGSVKGYGYDLKKSAQLLKQDGWVKQPDGFIYKNGVRFTFTIYTNQGNKPREEIATIAQQQWGLLGIDVKIRILAWNILLTQFIDKKKFDAVVMAWSLSRDPDCFDIWHSSKTKEGEFNFISYKNPEVDALLVRARTTFDFNTRRICYRRIHEILSADAPYTFLYTPDILEAVHRRIHGIVPAPAGIGYNQIKWYVPAELRKYKISIEK
jgi:peptide/nickel transport system substrate-binding protein